MYISNFAVFVIADVENQRALYGRLRVRGDRRARPVGPLSAPRLATRVFWPTWARGTYVSKRELPRRVTRGKGKSFRRMVLKARREAKP